MALQDTDISKVRPILLGLTGLSCLLYAILAVTQNTPQPIWWFVPTEMGGVCWNRYLCRFCHGRPRLAPRGNG